MLDEEYEELRKPLDNKINEIDKELKKLYPEYEIPIDEKTIRNSSNNADIIIEQLYFGDLKIKEESEDKIIFSSEDEDIFTGLEGIIVGGAIILFSGISILLLIGGFFLLMSLFVIFRKPDSITIDKKIKKVVICRGSHMIEEIPFSDIEEVDTVYSPPIDVFKESWYSHIITIQGKYIQLPSSEDESKTKELTKKIRKIMGKPDPENTRVTSIPMMPPI